jgi:hypothetical protein
MFLPSRSSRTLTRHGRSGLATRMMFLPILLMSAQSTEADDQSKLLNQLRRQISFPSVPSGSESLTKAPDANETRFLCQLATEIASQRYALSESHILPLIQRISSSALNPDLAGVYEDIHELTEYRTAADSSIAAIRDAYTKLQKSRQDGRDQREAAERLREIRAQNKKIDEKANELAKKVYDESETTLGGIFKGLVVEVAGEAVKTPESDAYKKKEFGFGYQALDGDLSARQDLEISGIVGRRDLAVSKLNRKIITRLSKIAKAESLDDSDVNIAGIALDGSEGAAKKLSSNPFALARLASSQNGVTQPEDYRTLSLVYLRCAQLCPDGSAYHDHRQQYLTSSAALMTDAAAIISGGSYAHGKSPTALEASSLWKAAFMLDDGKLGPSASFSHGRALALSGRFGDASNVMGSVTKAHTGDAGFALKYAKVLSLSGQPTYSIAWVKYCLSLDSTQLNHIRSSEDFSGVRTGLPSEFKEATSVKFSWSKELGYLSDEISLTNNSLFAITDVKFSVALLDSNLNSWEKDLFVESIAPGATKTWNLGFRGISARGVQLQGVDPVAKIKCAQD